MYRVPTSRVMTDQGIHVNQSRTIRQLEHSLAPPNASASSQTEAGAAPLARQSSPTGPSRLRCCGVRSRGAEGSYGAPRCSRDRARCRSYSSDSPPLTPRHVLQVERFYVGRMRSSGTSTRLTPLKLNRSSTRYVEGSVEVCSSTVPRAS